MEYSQTQDARRQAEYFESKQALENPSYTMGLLDDLQLQVRLSPPPPPPCTKNMRRRHLNGLEGGW